MLFVELGHDADIAVPLFIEVDGLGAGELECPVERTGGVKTQMGGDMLLKITVQRVAAGEMAEVRAFHLITFRFGHVQFAASKERRKQPIRDFPPLSMVVPAVLVPR
jgi:hypothetical protein